MSSHRSSRCLGVLVVAAQIVTVVSSHVVQPAAAQSGGGRLSRSGSATAAPGNAAMPGKEDQAFIQVAVTTMAFDSLLARCTQRSRLSTVDAAQVSTWQLDNRVADIRNEIAVREQAEPWRTWLEKARRSADSGTATLKGDPCTLTVAATRIPVAQFAKNAPAVLASLGQGSAAPPVRDTSGRLSDAPPTTSTPAGSTATSAGAVATSGTTAASSEKTAALLEQIDSFGLDTAAAMGVGGFITTRIYPVVLFKNGDVLTDVEGLSYPGGLDGHRRAKPKNWAKWRRNGSTIEITGSKGWEKLAFQTTYGALPPDLRLNGLYRHLGGTGNIAVGGTDAVTAFTDYTFFPDGHVIRGGGSGAQAQGGDFSTVVRSVAPGRRGTYRIDGLTLTITYEDGRRESQIIVTDPKDPKGAIWLDGVGYVQRGR